MHFYLGSLMDYSSEASGNLPVLCDKESHIKVGVEDHDAFETDVNMKESRGLDWAACDADECSAEPRA